MKRLLIAVALLIIIISGCVTAYIRLDLLTQELADHILESNAFLETGDREESNAILQETYNLWLGHRNMLGALVRHNELDTIQNLFLRALQAMDNRDDNEFYLQTRELHGMLLHIPEMERPSIGNIF